MSDIVELPRDATIGELYRPAMDIEDHVAAARYLAALVRRQMRFFGRTEADAEAVERSNLGYFAGYYDTATRVRVETLFGAVHPVFGVANPTEAQAVAAGRALAHADSAEAFQATADALREAFDKSAP